MSKIRHRLVNSGVPSHKSLETPQNLARRISYLLLTSYSGSFLEEFLESPDFFKLLSPLPSH